MKIKTAEKLMWGITALFALLRILQYVFAIGEDGFFVKDTLWQSLLSNSLYVLMAVFALLSFFIRLSKKNHYKSNWNIMFKPAIATLAQICAIAMVIYAIVLFVYLDWLGFFVLGAATYFILVYFFARGWNVPAIYYVAVCALAYPCARVVKMFFDTFKEIKVSENIIDMVAMCAMIIAIVALTKLCMGFEENMSKLGWSMWLFSGFGVLAGVGKLFGLIWTGALEPVSIMAAVSDLALWVLILAIYHSCTTFVPVLEEEPQEEENED